MKGGRGKLSRLRQVPLGPSSINHRYIRLDYIYHGATERDEVRQGNIRTRCIKPSHVAEDASVQAEIIIAGTLSLQQLRRSYVELTSMRARPVALLLTWTLYYDSLVARQALSEAHRRASRSKKLENDHFHSSKPAQRPDTHRGIRCRLLRCLGQ